MKFQDWTAKAVEVRILEMADTLRVSPAVRGPQAYGNNMPDPVRRHDESYGHISLPDIEKARRRPPLAGWSRFGSGSTPCQAKQIAS